jgi:hypothetical protein
VDTTVYSTDRLYVAAFVVCSGHDVVGTRMQQSPELLAAVASFLADGMIPARHFSFELLKLKRMLHGGEYVKRVEKNEENGDGVNRST